MSTVSRLSSGARFFRLAIAVVVGVSCAPAAAETNSLFAAAMDSITADELYHHVEVLADDVF
jgi:hypothetical protein